MLSFCRDHLFKRVVRSGFKVMETSESRAEIHFVQCFRNTWLFHAFQFSPPNRTLGMSGEKEFCALFSRMFLREIPFTSTPVRSFGCLSFHKFQSRILKTRELICKKVYSAVHKTLGASFN